MINRDQPYLDLLSNLPISTRSHPDDKGRWAAMREMAETCDKLFNDISTLEQKRTLFGFFARLLEGQSGLLGRIHHFFESHFSVYREQIGLESKIRTTRDDLDAKIRTLREQHIQPFMAQFSRDRRLNSTAPHPESPVKSNL